MSITDKLLNNGGNNRQLGENVPTLPPSNSTWCGQDNNGIIGTEEILLPTATTAGVPPKLSDNSNRADLLSPAKFQNWRRYFSKTPLTESERAGGRHVIKSVLYSWHVSAHLNKIISHPLLLLIFLSHTEKFGNI